MRKVLYVLSLTAALTSCSEGNKKSEKTLEKATAEEWKIASSMFGVLPTEAINEENPSRNNFV